MHTSTHHPSVGSLAAALCCFLFLFFGKWGAAQCPFDPTIEGDTILCPGDSSVLKTQPYDAYQWYRREWGSNDTVPIPGATGQSFTVTEADVLSYISVEVTLGGCTERSPEVLIDAWAFLLPVVIHSGNYDFDPNTMTFSICAGDTMFLTLSNPYDTNITWYRDGVPIPGETSQTLAVTTGGVYGVTGAPAICPNYVQSPGVDIAVEVDVCSATEELPPAVPSVQLWPNPSNGAVRLSWDKPSPLRWRLVDALGRTLEQGGSSMTTHELDLDLTPWPAGVYFIEIRLPNRRPAVSRVIKH